MKSASLGHPILTVKIRFEPDIVTARQKTRRLSTLLGFDSQDQVRLATAVSELARNVFQYASRGTLEFSVSDTHPQSFYVRVTDSGKGIAMLDQILAGTYVSKSGMGKGLIGSKRLMDEFDVETSPLGTQIIIGKRLPPQKNVTLNDIQQITTALISRQSENVFEEIQNQNRDLLTALEELRVKKAELVALNGQLSETNRGVVALYAELEEKASSLQKANALKTSFLSNMTHEFRTPLGSIISLTRLLIQGIDGPLNPEQERQVKYIQSSGSNLLELVNDLLDISKVDAGKVSIHPENFHVTELLGGLRGVFRSLLGANRNVQLNFENDDVKLVTDLSKLAQILRNLISNSIKFTESGTITVTARKVDQKSVQFIVSDTGIGIGSESLESIFEDFSQIDSKLQSKHKGTGLGLSLSRKLARLLGGDITVSSQLGVGSKFFLTIPAVFTGALEGVLIPETSPEKDLSIASAKFSVLLIDDDESARLVLKNLLRAELDASFEEAPNGLLGLQRLKTARPDLIFLDLAMPELDGFQFLKAVKQDESLKGIPIVVNTSKKLSTEETETIMNEAVAILSKDRNDNALAVRELRRALSEAGFDYRKECDL